MSWTLTHNLKYFTGRIYHHLCVLPIAMLFQSEHSVDISPINLLSAIFVEMLCKIYGIGVELFI